MQEMSAQSLCWEEILEKEIAPRSSIFVWETPGTEEPVQATQSMGGTKEVDMT